MRARKEAALALKNRSWLRSPRGGGGKKAFLEFALCRADLRKNGDGGVVKTLSACPRRGEKKKNTPQQKKGDRECGIKEKIGRKKKKGSSRYLRGAVEQRAVAA